MLITKSPLANLVDHPQDVDDRFPLAPWGVVIHTTGSGVPTKAKKLGIPALEVAISVYTAKGANFPHYVIDQDGVIAQIADEGERARHAGISPEDRKLYASGQWSTKISAPAAKAWLSRWMLGFGKKNPLQFFPTKSVNNDYLGVELIPSIEKGDSLFSAKQCYSLRSLLHDIEDRHYAGARRNVWFDHCPNLHILGHEDLEPLSRTNSKGGWDPGGLGATAFNWAALELF